MVTDIYFSPGDKTPAIAVVVYGNRACEDALLELTDILKENGFIIAGADAFIAIKILCKKVFSAI